jgi:hypothetical protein
VRVPEVELANNRHDDRLRVVDGVHRAGTLQRLTAGAVAAAAFRCERWACAPRLRCL